MDTSGSIKSYKMHIKSCNVDIKTSVHFAHCVLDPKAAVSRRGTCKATSRHTISKPRRRKRKP